MWRALTRIGADRLCHPGGIAIEDACRRLGGDVPRSEAGAAGGENNVGSLRQFPDRAGDGRGIVGNDPPLHVESLRPEQLGEKVAAAVVARAFVHPVGDCEDGGSHETASLVFETSVTSVTTIPLSTAFAMS